MSEVNRRFCYSLLNWILISPGRENQSPYSSLPSTQIWSSQAQFNLFNSSLPPPRRGSYARRKRCPPLSLLSSLALCRRAASVTEMNQASHLGLSFRPCLHLLLFLTYLLGPLPHCLQEPPPEWDNALICAVIETYAFPLPGPPSTGLWMSPGCGPPQGFPAMPAHRGYSSQIR